MVQGLGAAMASATGLSILVAAFPEGRERNRALGVFAAATGSGFTAGMILGGALTSMKAKSISHCKQTLNILIAHDLF